MNAKGRRAARRLGNRMGYLSKLALAKNLEKLSMQAQRENNTELLAALQALITKEETNNVEVR